MSPLAEVCERFHVTELSLFGSVRGDDFGPDSDVDVLYVGDPHLRYIRDRVLAEARPMCAA